MVESLKPLYVAPLVGFLSHESCQETGSVFEVGSGWMAKVRWQRTGGVRFPLNKRLTPEDISQKWQNVVNFQDRRVTYPANVQESMQPVLDQSINEAASESQGAPQSALEKALSAQGEEITMRYGEKEVILYALGLGATRQDLHLVYENASNFMTLPTFGVIPGLNAVNNLDLNTLLPSFNPVCLQHGCFEIIIHCR
jgi:multifunctional beta-oxidation protein